MIFLSILYFFITLLTLTALPVFSDEAIYIHWAQVAMREPQKYAFLSMLDGKPPLHIWLLMPFLRLFANPLFAGRLLSVLIGFFTIILIPKIVGLLGGNKKTQVVSMLFSMSIPYFYFHNRMALAESLLTFLFTVCLFSSLQMFFAKQKRYFALFALSFGAALWTKTTALFFIPVFSLIPALAFVIRKKSLNLKAIQKVYLSKKTLLFVLSGVLGGLLFGLLAFSPLFPSLFRRSVDYTFSLSEVFGGEWRYVFFHSLPAVLFWIIWYMTLPVVFLALFGGKMNRILAVMVTVYIFPLVLIGRVLSARYFFPTSVLFVLMGALGLQELSAKRHMLAKLFLGAVILWSGTFIVLSNINPSRIPFTKEDRSQYLLEWSSGYGIPEAVEYITAEAQEQKHITVAAEGFFGTLPNGLEIYFDKSPVGSKVSIVGIGEPVRSFPSDLKSLAQKEDVYVLVNENRFFPESESEYRVIDSYARPDNAPKLLLIKLLSSTQKESK